LVHGRPVPIAHAFLYGVVKGFLNSAFMEYKVSEGRPGPYVVTYEKREKIAELYAATATHLHGKDAPFSFIYRNGNGRLVSGMGSARMVDVEQFVCIYGPTVLAEAWNNRTYYVLFMAFHDAYVGIFDRDTQPAGKPTSLEEACDRCGVAQLPGRALSMAVPAVLVLSYTAWGRPCLAGCARV
jgi:hypothetical protein